MTDTDLARRLRVLRRTVLMLQTELRHEHMDEALIAEIDQQMERGIATEARCTELPTSVDILRESAIGRGDKRFDDTVRACERLKDRIEEIMSRLG